MSGEKWVCKNKTQFDLFCQHINTSWDWSKPLVISWTDKLGRSMGQNALLHVWIRTIRDHMNKIPGNTFSEEAVKLYLKRRFGLRQESKDLLTGEAMQILKPTSEYDKGELFQLLNQIEAFAAEIGCTLPVWGDYEQLLKEHSSRGRR